MDAIVTNLRFAPANFWRSTVSMIFISAGLIGCATNEALFARYDEAFCPVDGVAVATPQRASSPAAITGAALKWVPIVYFKTDKNELTPVARKALDDNVSLLLSDADHRVAVRGFTDASASSSYNQSLSRDRLTSVVQYLVKKGVDASRVVGSSHGESVPLARNRSPGGNDINRRVELMLLDRDGRPATVAVLADRVVPTN